MLTIPIPEIKMEEKEDIIKKKETDPGYYSRTSTTKNGSKVIKVKKPGVVYPDEIEGYDFVICPLCGDKTRIPLSIHLKRKHNMTMEDFRKDYPLYITVPKRYNRQMTKEEFIEHQKKKGIPIKYPNEHLDISKNVDVVKEKKIKEIVKKEDKNDNIEIIKEEVKDVDNFFIDNPFEVIYKKMSHLEDKIDRIERILTKIYALWK